MSRPTTIASLVLALFLLVAPPAAAKGPTQVEVHDLRTGVTTLLTDFGGAEMGALFELVDWPESRHEPAGIRSGALEQVATLSWQYDETTPAWTDRVYADETGRTWVQRRDHLSDTEAVTWGRVKAGFAFQAVLDAIGEQAEDTATTTTPATTHEAPAAAPIRSPAHEASAGFDAASFGWGAGAATLLAAGLVLLGKRRRSASVG
jgi:hypothetical protein